MYYTSRAYETRKHTLVERSIFVFIVFLKETEIYFCFSRSQGELEIACTICFFGIFSIREFELELNYLYVGY